MISGLNSGKKNVSKTLKKLINITVIGKPSHPQRMTLGNHEETNLNVMRFKKKVQKTENLRNCDFGRNKKMKTSAWKIG